MDDITSKNSDITSKKYAEGSKMAPAVEAYSLIRTIAGPMDAGTHVQQMLAAVARSTGLNFNRVRSIWHRDARISIRAEEMDALRQAAERRRNQEAGANAQFRSVLDQIAAMQRQIDEMAANIARERAGVGGRADHTRRGAADGGSALGGAMGGDR